MLCRTVCRSFIEQHCCALSQVHFLGKPLMTIISSSQTETWPRGFSQKCFCSHICKSLLCQLMQCFVSQFLYMIIICNDFLKSCPWGNVIGRCWHLFHQTDKIIDTPYHAFHQTPFVEVGINSSCIFEIAFVLLHVHLMSIIQLNQLEGLW